jgi:hypothetical protein
LEKVESPNPLHRELPTAPEYPVDALCPVPAPVAKAIHNLTQAPLSICCQSVLSVATLAVQGHLDILMPTRLRRPTSLYPLSIVESGDRKSSADSIALNPVKGYSAELNEKLSQKRFSAAVGLPFSNNRHPPSLAVQITPQFGPTQACVAIWTTAWAAGKLLDLAPKSYLR